MIAIPINGCRVGTITPTANQRHATWPKETVRPLAQTRIDAPKSTRRKAPIAPNTIFLPSVIAAGISPSVINRPLLEIKTLFAIVDEVGFRESFFPPTSAKLKVCRLS